MKNREVEQFLNMIDSAPSGHRLTKESIYDPPAKLYFTIRSLYQTYKKSNEFQLLQNKIHKIVIKQQEKSAHTYTRASVHTLCSQNKLSANDIDILIKIKRELSRDCQSEVLNQVIDQVKKLQKLKDVLFCFRKILKTPECIQQNLLYKQVEGEMIKKILELPLADGDFKSIADFIMSLPYLGEEILFFIGELFDKVDDIAVFKPLHMIFNRKFSQQSVPSANSMKAFMKILIGRETLGQIASLIKNYDFALQIAEDEAKFKLSQTETEITEKVRLKIDFVIFVVAFGCPIWHNIIQWQKRAPQDCEQYLKEKIESTLLKMMKEEKSFVTILNIASKMTEVEEKSQIGMIFLREFLNVKQKKYLNNIVIRRFIASKILSSMDSEQEGQYERVLFDDSLLYVEVLLEIFAYEKQAVTFYKRIIEDQDKCLLITGFLKHLSRRQPNKLKEFFIKVDQTSNGDLHQCKNYMLIQAFGEFMPFDVTLNYLHDISVLPISRFTLSILGQCLTQERYIGNATETQHLRIQVARTINMILLHHQPDQLNQEFRIHFPEICKLLTGPQKEIIMRNITPLMNLEIKNIFDNVMKKAF